MMFNTTPRGKDCRLCHVIQKGGKPLLYDVENDSERQNIATFYDVQYDSEASTAILCEVEVDTETNTVLLYFDVGYDSERQTLPSRVMY